MICIIYSSIGSSPAARTGTHHRRYALRRYIYAIRDWNAMRLYISIYSHEIIAYISWTRGVIIRLYWMVRGSWDVCIYKEDLSRMPNVLKGHVFIQVTILSVRRGVIISDEQCFIPWTSQLTLLPLFSFKFLRFSRVYPRRCQSIPPDHLLLDSATNLGPLISRWEINKLKNCWYKSVMILEVLNKLLFQQLFKFVKFPTRYEWSKIRSTVQQ